LFKYLHPERQTHVIQHGFNVTINENLPFNVNSEVYQILDVENIRPIVLQRELVKTFK